MVRPLIPEVEVTTLLDTRGYRRATVTKPPARRRSGRPVQSNHRLSPCRSHREGFTPTSFLTRLCGTNLELHMQRQGATVKVGQRVYNSTTWTRRDEIYVKDVRIGIIKLTCGDRKGRTISLITHASTHGRAIEWCVEQSTPRRPPKENYSQQDTHAREQQ
jgi:hypothetical protein